MKHKAQDERQRQARENTEAGAGLSGPSRVSSTSTVIHQPLDANGGINQQ